MPRAQTTVVDAYLSPVLRRYVDQVTGDLGDTRLYFMQSHGGLTRANHFAGKDAILSGPAGGIVGAARTAARAGFNRVIGFDMGGTSTDVALYAGGFERTFETEVAGVPVRAPMMAINTVAAGGGSVLGFDGARFRVGPDSAGANPGPAGYRRGGPLTVTDANICLGKINPAHFPTIFGEGGDAPIDADLVRERFAELADRIEARTDARWDPRTVAEGFVRVAVASMANAIKQISVQKGHDPAQFVLQCFGGAGGQHACLVADELGMDTVMVHPFAGVLSAYGMGLADQTVMREQAVETPFCPEAMGNLADVADRLVDEGRRALAEQGADPSRIEIRRQLHLRYAGTDAALVIDMSDHDRVVEAFTQVHRDRFGFATPERALVVGAVAVEATAPGETVGETEPSTVTSGKPRPIDMVTVWSGAREHRAPVYARARLRSGDRIVGPALVSERIATTVVEPGWAAEITAADHMVLRRVKPRARANAAGCEQADPILLELFNNLFMSAAEQMGVVLQNTSLSVNIKERLDFSCALFDARGCLVANAPHVPVHLGAMSESVRTVIRRRGATLKPGDVIALNNPSDGGTHLPDVTVVTPVFDEGGGTLRFFLGSRAHHADIGGLTPGSTPPNSVCLEDEGVVIDDFLLVDGGTFREAAFRDLLARARHPARSPDINVAEVKAQVAANQKGALELQRTCETYGWPAVQAYMRHVMDNAEEHVRRVIDRLSDGRFDYEMDDGTTLKIAVSIDRAERKARIDFRGTSPRRADNFNAPAAITRSVILYVFRCLVGDDIPLNEGCLAPIEITLPEGTFLSPRPGAAVVAGNTEVSQALCNALSGALGTVACSQATMNNFLFGDATRQYYETICGGAGAGPSFGGASAVHTHMTNTRMTDPEILELRYPVRLEEFSVRRDSGGRGLQRGGDGVRRRVRFLEPMTAVIVASRRAVPPFGLADGGAGRTGRQWIERADGTHHPLVGAAEAKIAPGEVFGIETPGGGGFGAPVGAGTAA